MIHQLPIEGGRPIVLIVDCHDDTRALSARALSAMDFEVVSASDSEDAYDRAWVTRPDIIVAEVPVPGVEGANFVQDLKDNPISRDIPIIILTEQDEHRSDSERADRECCSAVIVKPCRPDQLAFRLREVLSRPRSKTPNSSETI
jgi:DNA-binding response OmpR family regulator